MAPKVAVKKIQVVIEILEAAKKKIKHLWLAIIAGGAGERLFCKSNALKSKPFIKCPNSELTFLGETVKRYVQIGLSVEHILIIVVDDKQVANVKKDLQEFERRTGIVVPESSIVNIGTDGYNYAGAQLAACRIIVNRDPEAIIIGTPADQYIKYSDEFRRCIAEGINAVEDGLVIIGVRTNDLNLMMGCGHADYEPVKGVDFPKKPVKVGHFLEKPEKADALAMIEAGNTACNTGINILNKKIVDLFKGIDLDELAKTGGLKTDDFMNAIENKYLVIGEFTWFDCGTATSIWEASEKTPHHRNVTITEGNARVSREGCTYSLFWNCEDADLYGIGVTRKTILCERIFDRQYLVIASHDYAQQVKELLNAIKTEPKGLYEVGYDYVLDEDGKIAVDEDGNPITVPVCEGNELIPSNCPSDIVVCFVGVKNTRVIALKDHDGHYHFVIEEKSGGSEVVGVTESV